MTWNLQWLSEQQQEVKRTQQDYTILKQIFLTYEPDILAFQEVNDAASLYRIVPNDQYEIFMSSRIKNKDDIFNGSNQFTGFAVKKHLAVKTYPDITTLSSPAIALEKKHFKQKLRYGAAIKVTLNQHDIVIVSVHLKSGCFSPKQLTKKHKKSCQTLDLQRILLQQWINQQEMKKQPFILIGDFNHRISLNTANDTTHFLSRSNPQSTIKWLTKNVKGNCLTKRIKNNKPYYRRYKHLIDHGYSSNSFHVTSVQQIPYSPQQVEHNQLSDHCPIIFDLNFTPSRSSFLNGNKQQA
ncbi:MULTISPECIES: endonuclease/exonuclease/phosphatase family protein [unclassified Photobacterium]|uniref:endonuclease/exonuclease/phosphatase family protein n=1 Tax=unclassified Photobacterium TaxID=2628852 RepID=UPI001EDDC07A|nr:MULTISPECIES: endonuclease/exonuclease/phosphatase family protein [unclassified Photobacterium]MCG3864666.1 endonuclease/exonuclease/phosphatase family protein [Photobacterium sp. Ph6]MCG3877633.1 endonuclease/exonuclease/phosphatase family protein [Photobacterium sp. Ph5]